MVFLAILVGLIALTPPYLYLIGRIRDPFHPLIFIGLIVYFLVPHKMIFYSDAVLALGLSSEIYSRYLIVTGISMLGLYAGWIYAAKRGALAPSVTDTPHYDPNLMILAAIICIAISLPIHFLVSVKFDKDTSAYLSDLDQLWIPAAILMVQTYFLVAGNARRAALLLLAFAFVPPIERFWSYGQRADMIRVVAILGLFYMNGFRRPSKRLFIIAACVLGLLVMTMGFTRTLIFKHEASNRLDAIVKVIPQFFEGRFEPVDNGAEFLFGAAQVETIRQDGHYGWGRTFTIGIIGRALPRQFFPNKDDLIAYHAGYKLENIKYTTGLVIAGGSAPTGFGSGFGEFWWFCPVIWFAFAYAFQRVWQKCLTSGDIRYTGYFLAFAVASLYATTQDLLTAELNLIFVMVPLALVYRFAHIRSSRMVHLMPA